MGWVECISQGGGGGSSVSYPLFTKTLIGDDTSVTGTFTLTEDYHDYDLVLFETQSFIAIATPNSIDACFTSPSSRLTVNSEGTNQYGTYNKSGDTWTRTNTRNISIIRVWGLTCTNGTLTETQIYKASSLSPYNVTITSQDDLLNYDFIISVGNSNDYTEIIINNYLWSPKNTIYDANVIFSLTMPIYDGNDNYIGNQCRVPKEFTAYTLLVYASTQGVTISAHELSSARYYYVSGLTFTPNNS